MTEINVTQFGSTKQGEPVKAFTLKSGNITATVIELGAALVSLTVPDKAGNLTDVVLGFDDVAGYEQQGNYLGVVVGRHANRIANASFTLNAETYTLAANNGKNHLHGGIVGFSKRLWAGEQVPNGVRFTLHSPHMDEGYPGNLDVCVTYTLEGDTLRLHYEAVCDRDTLINLTNHSYFNLKDGGITHIEDHLLQVNAQCYCECDENVLTTGVIAPVALTPFDFTTLRRIGDQIDADHPQIRYGGGIDHNFVLQGGKTLREAAVLAEPGSGRKMTVSTDKPGIQIYTSNMLGDTAGKNGAVYGRRKGICMETQFFPNGIHTPNFPSPILKAGEKYDYTTAFAFSVE